MSLTNEDLQAITRIFSSGLEPVKNDISSLKRDVSTLKDDVSTLKGKISSLEEDMETVKNDIKIIKVDILENNVIPRLEHMEQCYLDASDRYINRSDEFSDNIARLDILEKTVKRHSDQIQELQLKQA